MLVSCDPGKHTCWLAFWGPTGLYGLEATPVDRLECLTVYEYWGLAIEVPQVYGGPQKEDPNDLIDLAVSAGRVIQSARWSEVTRYLPREWKGQTPKKIDNARTLKVLTPEERSVYDACGVAKSLRHNLLDAVGIGLRHLKRK